MRSFLLLLIFWGAQILAHVTFKFGSELKSRWLLCFITGNIIGVASIWILMKLYTIMPVNLALGLALGGGFLCTQIVIAIFLKTKYISYSVSSRMCHCYRNGIFCLWQ